MIKAWDEAIRLLSIGERAIITANPADAYGSSGIPGLIPINAKLLFDIQLLSFK